MSLYTFVLSWYTSNGLSISIEFLSKWRTIVAYNIKNYSDRVVFRHLGIIIVMIEGCALTSRQTNDDINITLQTNRAWFQYDMFNHWAILLYQTEKRFWFPTGW